MSANPISVLQAVKAPAGYTFRYGDKADISALSEVERRAAELFRSVGYDYCADGPVHDRNEHERILREGASLLAQDKMGAAVAFALLLPIDGNAHLLELGTSPDHQKKGLGRALVSAAETWGAANGFDRLTLITYRDVPWNMPFYERLGFQAFEPDAATLQLNELIQEERDSGFHFAPRVAMRKQLS